MLLGGGVRLLREDDRVFHQVDGLVIYLKGFVVLLDRCSQLSLLDSYGAGVSGGLR